MNGGVPSSGVATSGVDLCATEGVGVGGVVLYSSDKPRVGGVSCITCVGGGICVTGAFGTGLNFLRCFLFRNVVRPEPSTFTKYWSYSFYSMTFPVLSHLRGWLPIKF